MGSMGPSGSLNSVDLLHNGFLASIRSKRFAGSNEFNKSIRSNGLLQSSGSIGSNWV